MMLYGEKEKGVDLPHWGQQQRIFLRGGSPAVVIS